MSTCKVCSQDYDPRINHICGNVIVQGVDYPGSQRGYIPTREEWDAAQKEIKRMRAALEFYADDNWVEIQTQEWGTVYGMTEGGNVAREALGGGE